GVFFRNHGMGDYHIAAGVAPNDQMVSGQVDVLHLKFRLQAGAKDQRFAAITAEGYVITVVQFGSFYADSVDKRAVGGFVGQLDIAVFERKLRVHGGNGGVFHHHLAARRVAAHHQALVRYVLAFYCEFVNDQLNVGAGHDIRELDGHSAARGSIRLLRGGNIRLADEGGTDLAIPQIGCRLSWRHRHRGLDKRFHPKLMLAARTERNFIVGLENRFLNPHLVNVRSVGGIAVAKHYLTGFVQAHPGVLTGDLVIRKDDLAFRLIAAHDETLRGNTKCAAGEE